MPTFFQAGVIPAMLQGVYEGDINYETLAQHGDIGLGTFNAVDGEMIALDGQFYRVNEKGVAEIADPTLCTPFAVVSKSKPSLTFTVENISTLADLSDKIDAYLPTQNIFYIMRVDGEFEWLKLRSECAEPCSGRPLADTLPKLQTIYELTDVHGSLVVTRCPNYSAGFTIAGFHYHFIDQLRNTGGHVFDLKLKKAKVMVTFLRRFSVVLFNTKKFDEADLHVDVQSALKKTE